MSWTLDETDPDTSTIDVMFPYPLGMVYANGVNVRRWNGSVNTLLFTAKSFRDGVYWGGKAYIAILTTGGTVSQVWRYNDAPEDWTNVDDPGTGPNPNVLAGVRPLYDGSLLMHDCGQITAPSTMLVRRSSDGTTWVTDTMTDCTRTRLGFMMATPYGDFIWGRRTSDGNDYIWKRGGSNTWTISSLNLTTGGYSPIYHYGDEFPAIFVIRNSDSVIMYSQDGGASFNATSYTNVGGTRIFGSASPGYCFLSTNDEIRQWNEASNDFDILIDSDPPGSGTYVPALCLWNGKMYATKSQFIYVNDSFSYGEYSVTPGFSPVAMDIGPDDYYLYIGALTGGNPVLLRLLADLTADPTEMYDPGAGSAIGVRCGRVNAAWVWIAGDFGGGIKVRNSIDDGSTWITKDPGIWNGVALPLVLGPNDDNLVLVPTDGDDFLFETEDGGLTWATLNNALPFDVGGMDRLDINLDEIIFGSNAGRDIRYTPNNGISLHDLTDVSMDDVAITDVIVG